MLIGPELQALQRDDRPQRAIQRRLVDQADAWRETPQMRAIMAELPHFAGGTPLADLPALAALFAPDGAAANLLVGGLVDWLADELAAAPLGQVPLRHHCERACAMLVLARTSTATLALQAFDGAVLARQPQPGSISFSPTETWERVVAGEARAERVRKLGQGTDHAALLERAVLPLGPGNTAHRQGLSEGLLLGEVRGVLVLLKLQRLDGSGGPSREYALNDGRLLHQAAGSPRDSRLELTAALLRQMGRADAAPLLADIAVNAGSAQLRWQMLRECLALDSAAGFAALTALADRAGDPLAAPAQALRGQLLQTYPQLAGVEPCPA